MKNNPPWAARNNVNDRILVSKRVGCFTFNFDLLGRPRSRLPQVADA